MTARLNETHDPALASWVDSANRGASDFPIQKNQLSRQDAKDAKPLVKIPWADGSPFG